LHKRGKQIGNTIHRDTVHECNTTLSRAVQIAHDVNVI